MDHTAPETLDQVRENPERAPSERSLFGLDTINFLMADVQGGVGPYLSAFLVGSRHWQPAAVGAAMAASALSAALCQIPAGMYVDLSHHKRSLTALSGLIVAAGCLLIVRFAGFWPVIAAQIMLGAASAVIPSALAALSLGLVGPNRIAARVSRNQSFNHGGSFIAAALAGVAGQYVGAHWIFYLVCLFAVASAGASLLIVAQEIDHDVARGGEGNDREPLSIRALLFRRKVVVFLVTVLLFHLGNAAMLPFAGQELARTYPGSDTMALSACVITAQLVMMATAWSVGRVLEKGAGRKFVFLVAFAVLPVRGVLFALFGGPYAVVAIQLLDGVAAGIFGVIAIIIAADLTRGTGRFNLMQGMVALCVSVGGAASNAAGGAVVQHFGFTTGFLSLAAIAAVACIFFLFAMPETRPDPA